jgi:diacylglycerol O-acyltransferase / wax synthase
MERLSGLDATFLYFETPATHQHVSAVMVFDPSGMRGGYSFERVKEYVRERLHLIPQFRRRLAAVPFNLHHPVWIEDPDFDLDYHVRRIAVPSPGGPEELADLAGDIASRQLDRSRPLWEMWVVEGLEHGHVGLVAKMHHCTIDGVSGANMMVYLFDLSPEPQPVEPPDADWEPDRRPTDLELVGYAIRSRLAKPVQLARNVPPTVQGLVNLARRRMQSDSPSGATPLTAPRTSFNGAITPHRKVSFTNVPLSDVKLIKDAFGTTVNDVVLAITTGALRRYLGDGLELPDRPLVASCPVSVRNEETESVVGSNKVSAMFVNLPVQIDDPVDQLMAIRESTKGAKEDHNAIGATFLMGWAELAAPRTFGLAARLYSSMKLVERHPVVHNLVISNVPGPPFPLYFAGARLVSMNPLGPIFDGAGLNITVLSYLDSIGFGFIACRELMPNLWELTAAITDAAADLKKAATARAAAPAEPVKKAIKKRSPAKKADPAG